MRLINPKFCEHWVHFLLQVIFISVFIFCVIAALFYIEKRTISLLTAIGISSLSASCFILFALPQSAAAVPHRAVGGYILAIICGVGFHALAVFMKGDLFLSDLVIYGLAASLAAGFAIFFMGLLDLEHPPAIGFALGLVIQQWNAPILWVIAIAILFISAVKHLLRNHLWSVV